MKTRIALAALVAAIVHGCPAYATLNSTSSTVSYTGNASTTIFTVPFKFLAASDLVVTVGGLTKTLNVDYTVRGAGNATGTVTFTTAPATSAAVVISRLMPLTQPASVRNALPFPAGATIDTGLDRATMQLQQIDAKVSNPVLPSALTNATPVTSRGSTTAQQLQDWFTATANIKSFGSVGDGVADDGQALTAAIASLSATGGQVDITQDITLIAPLTITVSSIRPLILDLHGHTITLKNTSGVGITVANPSGLRFPITIAHGIIAYGGTTAGITGMLLSRLSQARVEDILFTGFTSANQTVLLLDFSEDITLDGVLFMNNTGTNTISLDLTNFASANAYHNVQFQSNYQAIRIRGGSSQNWFSDCLVQSNTGPNAVVVQVTGADANITGTTFQRCHFESNGDSTANSSAIYFNTDVGKNITNTYIAGNYFQGSSRGNLGVAWRFSATGSPAGSFTSSANYIIAFATVTANSPSGSTAIVSLNDNDTTNTLRSTIALGKSGVSGAGSWGETFCPTGATTCFQIYGGFPGQFDTFLVFRDITNAVDILRYSPNAWDFPKPVKISSGLLGDGAGYKHKRSVAGCATAASVAAVCSTTFTWTTAFADTSYTVTCLGNGITSGAPILQGITAKVAASVTVQTIALTAAAAQFTAIECVATHD